MCSAEVVPAPDRLRLQSFLDLLYREGRALNLTRVPVERAWERHVEEALDLLRARHWADGERVIDLGSGGGIPGVPLAIALPQISLRLVERDQGKASFLALCQVRLGLGRLQVVACDARELARSPGFEPAQVLVSRAALPPPELVRLAGRLLGPGGEGLVHVGAKLALDPVLRRAAERAGLAELRLQAAGRSSLLRFERR